MWSVITFALENKEKVKTIKKIKSNLKKGEKKNGEGRFMWWITFAMFNENNMYYKQKLQ